MSGLQRWARKAEVKARYSANDRELTDLQSRGFPRPTYFGPRSPRWSIAALDEFDRKVESGEIVLVAAHEISAATAKARTAYMERVASGEVRASRQATAARKRAEQEAQS